MLSWSLVPDRTLPKKPTPLRHPRNLPPSFPPTLNPTPKSPFPSLSFLLPLSPPPTLPKKPKQMVLLIPLIAAIPTTIGVSQAVSAQRRQNASGPSSSSSTTGGPFSFSASTPVGPGTEKQQMRKFTLECYCAGHRAGRRAGEIHGGRVVLRGGKVSFCDSFVFVMRGGGRGMGGKEGGRMRKREEEDCRTISRSVWFFFSALAMCTLLPLRSAKKGSRETRKNFKKAEKGLIQSLSLSLLTIISSFPPFHYHFPHFFISFPPLLFFTSQYIPIYLRLTTAPTLFHRGKSPISSGSNHHHTPHQPPLPTLSTKTSTTTPSSDSTSPTPSPNPSHNPHLPKSKA